MNLASVVIPINNDKYLRNTLSSLRGQFTDLETLLVSDNLDLDKRQLELEHKNIGLRVLQSPGSGIVKALNFGIEASSGKYIVRIDADDVMVPQRIVNQVNFLEMNESYVAIGGQMIGFTSANSVERNISYPTSSIQTRQELMFHSALPHPGTTIKKSALVLVGGYRDFFPYVEDWDLWLRLSEVGELSNLASHVTRYRVHPEQTTKIRKSEIETSKESVVLSAALRIRGKLDHPEKCQKLSVCTK